MTRVKYCSKRKHNCVLNISLYNIATWMCLNNPTQARKSYDHEKMNLKIEFCTFSLEENCVRF